MMLVVAVASLLASALAAPNVERRASHQAQACASFKYKEQCDEEAPEDLGCVWAPTKMGNWEEADYACQPTSCETLSNSDFGDPEALCKGDATCTWNEEVYACLSKNAPVPCELYYVDASSGEKCPTGCEYNAAIEKCATVGEAIKCDEVYESTMCGTAKSGGCTWYEDIYKCWETGQDPPCVEYEYMMEKDCPSHCKWQQTGHGTYSSEEGKCMEQDEQIGCDDFYEKSSCSTEASGRCEWHAAPMEMCWPKGRAIPCGRMRGASCAAAETCTWSSTGTYAEDGACAACKTPGPSCVQKWNGPSYEEYGGGEEYGGYSGADDGKACNTYAGETLDNCPSPRCFRDYGDGDGYGGGGDVGCGGLESEGECRDPTCADLEYDDQACTKKTGCTYDDESGSCYGGSGDFPCKNLYDKEECTSGVAAGKCTWSDLTGGGQYESGAGVCYVAGKMPKCNEMDAYDEEMCTGGPQTPKCTWSEQTYSCHEANYMPPCSNYDDGNCPSPRCELTQGVCWEKGEELPCNAICAAVTCQATGKCQWQERSYQCTDCPATGCPTPNTDPCNTFKSEEQCPESRCEFMFYDAEDTGECTDRVCTEKYEKAECEAAPAGDNKACVWKPSPEYAGSGQCFPQGLSFPCNMAYDQAGCTAQGCDWDAEQYHCNEKGDVTPCTLFYGDKCPTDRCVSENGSCRHKDFNTNVPNWATLAQQGDGTGNEDKNSCTSALYEQVKKALEDADAECIVVGRRERKAANRARRVTQDQIECLEYFLEQSGSTIAAACPCLWAWASEVEVYEDHWMMLKC